VTAPVAPSGSEGPRHREGFSRPETTLEKIGYAGSTAFGYAGVAIVHLLVLFGIVVGVPAWSVMGSPSYAEAKRFVANDDLVLMEVGGEVAGFDLLPARYRVSRDRAEYSFDVQGAVTKGTASVTVSRTGGVWAVTSASFVAHRGRPVVLRPGK